MGEVNTVYPIEKVIINDIEVPVAVPSGYANVGDTTATADTVMEGKEFYNAQGEKTVGTYKDMLQARVDSVNSCYYLFYRYSGKTIDFIDNLNTNKVTDMQYMFSECTSLENIRFPSTFNAGNGKTQGMFSNCYKLQTLDLSSFNTSQVYDMSYMFSHCRVLSNITFGDNFNTSNVINMASMFNNCQKLSSLDLSHFNTSKVTSMGGMFDGCSKLLSLDISNFNTSNVTSMNGMFNSCKVLAGTLDISHFDMTKVTDTVKMFYQCQALTNVILPSTIKRIDGNFFGGCSLLTEITILATEPPTLANTTNCISAATTKIKIPHGTLSAYQSATNWSAYSDLFEELPA